MRRLLKIALREYLSYVRTIGFWLSMAGLPLGMALAITAPTLIARSAPVPAMAIIDLSGRNLAPVIQAQLRREQDEAAAAAMASAANASAGPKARQEVRAQFDAEGLEAARSAFASAAPKAAAAFEDPAPDVRIVPAPTSVAAARSAAEVVSSLKPFLQDRAVGLKGTPLDLAAVITAEDGTLALDLWSRNISVSSMDDRLKAILQGEMRRERLSQLGVPDAQLKAVDRLTPVVRLRSPKSAGEAVSLRDRLPTIIGFSMAMGLWTVILSGAGILLNSVVEDKSSRVLEVLLASASTTEIMGGKILGVAGVTFSVLGIWLAMGTALLFTSAPGIAGDLVAILATKGLAYYFGYYLVGGYLMYACIFTAIGAFCETTREAQTLVAPLMLILSVPMIFMSQSILHPDMPIMKVLCWIPPFTPFLMMVRAAANPSLWEIVGTGMVMATFTALTIWLSGKAFRVGALSTSRLEPKALFLALIGRKANPA